jgi:hypothetical protein
MTEPMIPMHYITAIFVAYILILGGYMIGSVLVSGLQRWVNRRRMRRVIGARVRAPEWGARKLRNGDAYTVRIRNEN